MYPEEIVCRADAGGVEAGVSMNGGVGGREAVEGNG